MKIGKISALVAIMACVTVGGAWAAWVYPGNQVASYPDAITHTMESVDFAGSSGVLSSKEGSNSLGFRIDQTSPTNWTAKMALSGSVTLTFKPHENISDEMKDQVKNAVITVSVASSSKYLDETTKQQVDIFVANTNFSHTLSQGATQWDTTTNPELWTYELKAADLDGAFYLGGKFVLPTYEDYREFQVLQARATLRLIVTVPELAAVTPELPGAPTQPA